jgi:SAM-dependent methyltransferase
MINDQCHACRAEKAYQQFYWMNNELILDTVQCKFCKHIFRNYKGDIEEYHREKYRLIGEEGHKMYPKEERLKYISTILECAKPFINKDMSALEIGSGDGLFATEAKDCVGKIICSDIDSKMTKMCEELGFESLAINVLDLEDNKKFDVIFGFDVLEHVLDIQNFKEKMNKITNQYLILQVPVDRTMVPPNNYDRGTADSFDGHSHYFSIDSISDLFKEYFDIARVFYAHRGKLARGPELLCIFRKKNEDI